MSLLIIYIVFACEILSNLSKNAESTGQMRFLLPHYFYDINIYNWVSYQMTLVTPATLPERIKCLYLPSTQDLLFQKLSENSEFKPKEGVGGNFGQYRFELH